MYLGAGDVDATRLRGRRASLGAGLQVRGDHGPGRWYAKVAPGTQHTRRHLALHSYVRYSATQSDRISTRTSAQRHT